MIRANGGICILLHMSLPNGCLHTEVMIGRIEHGAQVSCCVCTTRTNILRKRKCVYENSGQISDERKTAETTDREREGKGGGIK